MNSDNDSLVINEFMKATVKNLTVCLKSSFDLPVKGNSEESVFNEFPQYKKILNGLSLKLLNNIQHLIDKQNGKVSLLDSTEKKGLDDKFNILVEVNDRLLDKCNDLITSIENPNADPKPSPIVVVEYTKSLDHLRPDGSKMTPQQTIKLLSSVQIERPQLKFAKLPDNSKVPFRPILTEKPNAIEPLELSLVNNSGNNNEEEYPHPYQRELDAFTTPNRQMIVNPNPDFPQSLEATQYEYIDTQPKLMELIDNLLKEREIAVDLEHHSVRTYLGLTCLIQISTRTADYVIDSLALHDHLEVLNRVFTAPHIEKVFHGSNSDLMWLQRDFGVYVVNLFDTGHACVALRFPRKSLGFLLEKYCRVQANKEYQRLTDWRVRPLIDELVEYARTDTHYLLYIADRLRAELSERGLLGSVFDSGISLCGTRYVKPRIDNAQDGDWMELYRKSSENFNERQLHALRRLWELRDGIARDEDESAPFVLPNRVLLAIAQGLPREPSGVLACCSQEWKLPLLRKYVFDVQKVCLEAYGEPISAASASTNGGGAAVVATTGKVGVLEWLLSKHDRTVTVDDDIAIECAPADVAARMKIIDQSASTPIMMTLPTVVNANAERQASSSDIAVAREYLRLHTSSSVTSPTVVNATTSDEPLPSSSPHIDTDEGEIDDDSEVEIVNIEAPTPLPSQPQAPAQQRGRKRPATTTPTVAATTTPFDYGASLKDMQRAGSIQNHVKKQFKPFAAKKFKKNQKKTP